MTMQLQPHYRATNSDRFNYVLGRTYNRQICAVLTTDGQVDADRMVRAVRLIMDAEPVLGCRLVRGKQPYWERRDDLDLMPFCTVMETEDMEGVIQKTANETTDPFCDPLFSIRILRSTTDTLLIRLEHTVSDGGGAKDVLYRLAELYRRLGNDPNYRPRPNVRGDRSFKQLFWSLGISGKLRLLRPFPHAEPLAVFPYHNPDRDKRAVAIRRIEPPVFQRMRSFGRERGATVNDILLTAFYRTFFRLTPTPFPVNVPVDLRAFIRGRRAGGVANLTSGYYPAVRPCDCKDFDGALRTVSEAMAVWRKRGLSFGRPVIDDLFGIGPPIEVLQRIMEPGYALSEQTGRIVPVLTNLGVIDSEKVVLDELKVSDAYIIGPVVYPPFFTVGACTFADRLTLLTGYCRETEGDQPVEAFLDEMKNELERIVR